MKGERDDGSQGRDEPHPLPVIKSEMGEAGKLIDEGQEG
jgi:hypothetical protein